MYTAQTVRTFIFENVHAAKLALLGFRFETGASVEWNFNLDIAAGCRGVHGGDNEVNVAMNGGALRIAKDDDRDTAAF